MLNPYFSNTHQNEANFMLVFILCFIINTIALVLTSSEPCRNRRLI